MIAKFKRINYPDGQISAVYEGSVPLSLVVNKIIKERINSYSDLFYVRAIADVINNTFTTNEFELYIPCMFGQRSDRRFNRFQSFDLKLICDVINECKWSKVSIFDPHSDVTLSLIDRSEKVSSLPYVKMAYYDILERQMATDGQTERMLVSPDAGAYKKVFEYAKEINCSVVAANKYRDKEGKVDLMFTHDVEGKDCLIVDDLCDGGYTFYTLGKKLKENYARNVYLYVSHGLFSKGFVELCEVIDHIYCTNSIKDVEKNVGKKYRSSDDMYPDDAVEENYITQFKVI